MCFCMLVCIVCISFFQVDFLNLLFFFFLWLDFLKFICLFFSGGGLPDHFVPSTFYT